MPSHICLAIIGPHGVLHARRLTRWSIGPAIAHFKQHNVEFESEWQPGDTKFRIRNPDGRIWEVSQEE